MITTLNKIRAKRPCLEGWGKLLCGLNKTAADDEPLSIARILDINGLDDAIWCLRTVKGHDREIRLYAVWCARRVQHLMTDPRSVAVLDVAERYARGEATDEELRAARGAAVAAAEVAGSAARAAAWAAAWAAWEEAAGAAVEGVVAGAAAAWVAAAAAGAMAWTQAELNRDAERKAQAEELRRICEEAAT